MNEPKDDKPPRYRTVWVVRSVCDSDNISVFADYASAKKAEELAHGLYSSVTLTEYPILVIAEAKL